MVETAGHLQFLGSVALLDDITICDKAVPFSETLDGQMRGWDGNWWSGRVVEIEMGYWYCGLELYGSLSREASKRAAMPFMKLSGEYEIRGHHIN